MTFTFTERVLQELKDITYASYVLQDQTAAHNIPEIYEKGTAKIKGLKEKWDIFKCANYLINQTVSTNESYWLYKNRQKLQQGRELHYLYMNAKN